MSIKIGESKYQGVSKVRINGKQERWQMSKRIKGKEHRHKFKTEKEAAFAYDKLLIENGMSPVNILNPK